MSCSFTRIARFGTTMSRNTSCRGWESERLSSIGRIAADGGAPCPFSRLDISVAIVPLIRWRLSFARFGLGARFGSTSRSASLSTARKRRSPKWKENFMICSMRGVDEKPNQSQKRTAAGRHSCNRCRLADAHWAPAGAELGRFAAGIGKPHRLAKPAWRADTFYGGLIPLSKTKSRPVESISLGRFAPW